MRAAEFTRDLQGHYTGQHCVGQIPAFVCDTLKRVSHKQTTKVDYNRFRTCKPYFWYNSMQR